MPASTTRRARSLLRLWAVVSLSVLAATIIVRWPGLQKRSLAERWRADLESAALADMPAIAEQLFALGEEGVAALARSIGSPRAEVADFAAAAIERRLIEWELDQYEERSLLAPALARSLAEAQGDLSAEASQRASMLAYRLLLLPLDFDAAARLEYIANCERVLRAAEPAAPPGPRVAENRSFGRARQRPLGAVVDVDVAAALPGGAAAPEPVQPAALPPAPAMRRMPAPAQPVAPANRADEPRLLLDGNFEEFPTTPVPAGAE